MNNSVIVQMLYGKRGNVNSVKPSEECNKALDSFEENERRLIEKISDADVLALYQKVKSSHEEYEICVSEDFFAAGFRFGVLMGLDIAEKQ